MSRSMLDQLRRKLTTRLSNLAARAVVRVVNNSSGMQLVQIDDLPGGPFDGAEHFQPPHLSWTPADGSLAVAIFPNGDLARPLVVATADPRDRPTDGVAGEFTLYHRDGQRVTFKNGGDIEVCAAPGRKTYIADGAGGTSPPALLSDVQALRSWVYDQFGVAKGHIHGVAGLVTTTITTAAVPFSAPAPSVPPTPVGANTVEVK